MKYFMLAQWAKEHKSINQIIDRVGLSQNTLIISFSKRQSLCFLLNSSTPLVYLYGTDRQENMQTNQLWAHLVNAIVVGSEIHPNDRIIYFEIKQKDIYQESNEFVLIFECMPPQPNLILCKKEGGKLKIQDAINKYAYSDNPQRQILPGFEYEPPHTTFKPELQEIRYPLEVKSAIDDRIIQCQTMDEYFVAYNEYIIEQKELAVTKKNLLSKWQKELKKAEKKLFQQEQELKEADLLEKWLTYSELIKVNLHQIKKGDISLEAINYYDAEMPTISIPLQSEISAQDNLKYYLKKYRKAKQGKDKIALQLSKTRQTISEIKQVLLSFETDTWKNLFSEQADAGKTLDKLKQTDNLFRLFVNEHWEIVIGRKAKENDMISTQLGKPNDWWFHTRIYRGSHILLRNFHKKELSPRLAELCCGLAAWFSKARNSSNVPVDYTQIRFVRKPRKSAPGLVTYTNQKTVFVEPIDPASAKEIIKGYAE
jgi:predicted ribosome quality control (RQC) complex YloA/Tae2 family protein